MTARVAATPRDLGGPVSSIFARGVRAPPVVGPEKSRKVSVEGGKNGGGGGRGKIGSWLGWYIWLQ